MLRMVWKNTIEFENDILTKHNAKNLSFVLEEEVEIVMIEKIILEEMLPKRIIRVTTHESTEFLPLIFIAKKPDGGAQLIWT